MLSDVTVELITQLKIKILCFVNVKHGIYVNVLFIKLSKLLLISNS